jgi:hypothetical protein
MKSPRDYIADFHPPLERLESLIERVQKDAYDEGVREGSAHMFEIVRKRVEQIDRKISDARSK